MVDVAVQQIVVVGLDHHLDSFVAGLWQTYGNTFLAVCRRSRAGRMGKAITMRQPRS